MTHDPLCGLSQPCDDEIPEHGYCSMQHGQFCIHCHQWCMCGEVRQAEQRMLAKCIEAVDAERKWWRDTHFGTTHLVAGEWNDSLQNVLAVLRGLEEKP